MRPPRSAISESTLCEPAIDFGARHDASRGVTHRSLCVDVNQSWQHADAVAARDRAIIHGDVERQLPITLDARGCGRIFVDADSEESNVFIVVLAKGLGKSGRAAFARAAPTREHFDQHRFAVLCGETDSAVGACQRQIESCCGAAFFRPRRVAHEMRGQKVHAAADRGVASELEQLVAHYSCGWPVHGDKSRLPTPKPINPSAKTISPCAVHRCHASWLGQPMPTASAPPTPPTRPANAPDKRGVTGSVRRHASSTLPPTTAPKNSAIKPQPNACPARGLFVNCS